MTLTALRNPLSVLLFLGVSLLPVYVFRSGGVQPAHLALGLFALGSLFRHGYRPEPWSLFILVLAVYGFFLDSFYVAGDQGDPKFLLNAAYLFFNFLIAQSIARHVEQNGVTPVLYGVFVAAAIAAVSSTSTGVNLQEMSETGRETGTFNNPNQLGYFSVCLFSLTYFFYATKRIRYLTAAAIMALALFLSVLSLSKAAILANGVVLFLALKPRLTLRTLLLWGGSVATAGFVLSRQFLEGAFENYIFVQRIVSMSIENDSSLGARGYFAFLDGNFVQILFGLGSQNVFLILGHEVHSTFGSILNQYGVVGLFLFLSFFAIWSVKLINAFGFIGFISIVGPAALYGVTHNGTRFAIFWILVATSIGYVNSRKALGRYNEPRVRTSVSGTSQASSFCRKISPEKEQMG